MDSRARPPARLSPVGRDVLEQRHRDSIVARAHDRELQLATQGEAEASIQRDSGGIVREYMKERDVPPSPDSARYGGHHLLAEALGATGRGAADDRGLSVSTHLHALSLHGSQI